MLRAGRNCVEWKSDNYRIKETIFIQTSRRGADTEWVVPLSHVVDKNSGGMDILGAKSPRPTPGPPAQDSRARKISPHNFWLQKPVGIESVEETAGAPSSFS